MSLRYTIAVFYTSLLALPLSYVLNSVAFYGKDQRLILLAGACCLLLIFAIPQVVLRKSKPPKIDSFFHGMKTFYLRESCLLKFCMHVYMCEKIDKSI